MVQTSAPYNVMLYKQLFNIFFRETLSLPIINFFLNKVIFSVGILSVCVSIYNTYKVTHTYPNKMLNKKSCSLLIKETKENT